MHETLNKNVVFKKIPLAVILFDLYYICYYNSYFQRMSPLSLKELIEVHCWGVLSACEPAHFKRSISHLFPRQGICRTVRHTMSFGVQRNFTQVCFLILRLVILVFLSTWSGHSSAFPIRLLLSTAK